MRTFVPRIVLVASLLVVTPRCGLSQGQIELRLSAKKCFAGVEVNPPAIAVTIFDGTKVSQLLQLRQTFRQYSNPSDPSDANKMLDAHDSLARRVRTTPALYRSSQAFSGEKLVKVRPVKRLVIFAFGDDEGELTSVAEREIDPKPGAPVRVVLNLSPESECPK